MESPRASRAPRDRAAPARADDSVATADPKDADAGAAPRPLDARIVLGIDPGTRIVGFGAVGITARGPVLLGAGVIRTDPAASMPSRLGTLRRELDRILSELRPGVVVVEDAFAHRNVQSALRLGEGRGVVLSCASAAGVEVEQIPPAVAKKALVGFGAAHKTQVAAMVARMLSLDAPPKPLDATDALALALTHLVRRTAARLGIAGGRALRR